MGKSKGNYKNGKKTTKNKAEEKHAGQSEATTSTFIEGIDDLDDNVRAELPNQEHCTWFLNIIQIHAKKIAKQLIDEQKTQLLAKMKEELIAVKIACKTETDELKRSIEEL